MTRHQYNHARVASRLSKDPINVGAALVSPNGFVILTACNGIVQGAAELRHRYEKPYKSLFMVHAEQNLIATAARLGIKTEGCSIFITHMPCTRCTNLIIAAGIKRIFYGTNDYGSIKDHVPNVYNLCRETYTEIYKLGPDYDTDYSYHTF